MFSFAFIAFVALVLVISIAQANVDINNKYAKRMLEKKNSQALRKERGLSTKKLVYQIYAQGGCGGDLSTPFLADTTDSYGLPSNGSCGSYADSEQTVADIKNNCAVDGTFELYSYTGSGTCPSSPLTVNCVTGASDNSFVFCCADSPAELCPLKWGRKEREWEEEVQILNKLN